MPTVSGDDLRAWAPVASAIAAALAAIASWRSVKQARRAWEHSLLPVIESSIRVQPPSGVTTVTFRNVGSGVGSLVWVRLVLAGHTIVGLIPDDQANLLRPGEGFKLQGQTVEPVPVPLRGVRLVVACTDINGDRRYFPTGGRPFVLRKPRRTLYRWWLRYIRRVPSDAADRDRWAATRAAKRAGQGPMTLEELKPIPHTIEFLPSN